MADLHTPRVTTRMMMLWVLITALILFLWRYEPLALVFLALYALLLAITLFVYVRPAVDPRPRWVTVLLRILVPVGAVLLLLPALSALNR